MTPKYRDRFMSILNNKFDVGLHQERDDVLSLACGFGYVLLANNQYRHIEGTHAASLLQIWHKNCIVGARPYKLRCRINIQTFADSSNRIELVWRYCSTV
jgi:hypothetical protein